MIFTETPRRQQITKFVSWGHWFAFANIIIAVIISSVYILSSPSPTSIISTVYLFATWLGHSAFLIFFGFILIVLPLCYRLTNDKWLRGASSVIAALALALLAFDALIFNKTGFHFNFAAAELLKNETQGRVNAFGWLQWFYLGLLFIIWLMCQLVLANAIFKRITKLQSIHIGKYVTTSLVVCFVGSHAIHVWADANLYTPVLKQDNMFPLSYPATAKTLMSRAGLLDLSAYQQKQQLQFNDQSLGIKYPRQAVYCSIDNQQKIAIFHLTDKPEQGLPSLPFATQYFVSESAQDDYITSIFYALPPILFSRLRQFEPVMVGLPRAFDLPVHYYQSDDNQIYTDQASDLKLSFEQFLARYQSAENGIFVAELSSTQFAQFNLNSATPEHTVLLSVPELYHHTLYSNIKSELSLSSSEDIAPTVLHQLGCEVAPENYSSGQAMQNKQRNWLVSTQDQNLIVIQGLDLIEVGRDGSFEIRKFTNNERQLKSLDTNLLSRAIRHLETRAK